MSKDTPHAKHTQKPSVLDNFNLGFEYDVTWSEVKKSLKERTI